MKNLPFSITQILWMTVLGLLVLVGLNLRDPLSRKNELERQRDFLQTRVTGLEATKTILESNTAYAKSTAAVEDYAYDSHMVRKGEQRIVPVSKDQVMPTSTPAPLPTQRVYQNYEVWWSFLFKDR